MRILNIMLGGKRGGIEQAAVNYAAALRHAGHDVTTMIRKGAAIAPALAAGGFDVQALALPYRWNPLAAAAVRRAMEKADAVILHGNRAAQLTARRQQRRGGPPVIAVVHSRFFNVMPHFSALITLSRAMQEKQRENAACPVYFVPNTVDMPGDVPRAAFRPVPVIGALGRLSPEKGMDLFIEAIDLLRQRGVMVEGVIGGAGGIEDSLKAQAARPALKGAVRFAGWVGDKRAFFEGIDVFCLSSRSETFSITLLEAMAHGVPSVATRCGGPTEIIADGVTGLLADIDAEAIANALQAAIQSPPDAARMGQAGAAKVAETYALPVIARQLDDILRGLEKGTA